MHLIKDENGNPIPHGAHEQQHCHGQAGGEGCGAGCASDGKCKNETVALLTYMLHHNEQHAAELDQMAGNLDKLGLADAARQIRDGVSDFQKGNMRLSLALTLVKEQLKEDE